MMKQILIVLVVMTGLGVKAWGQTGSFSGKVIDQRTKEPLAGATIQLEGTSLGAMTDSEGSYTITDVPPKTYNIQASFIGYQALVKFNVVIRSEGNIDINFELSEEAEELEGVEVTANPFSKLDETPLSVQKLSQEEVAVLIVI